jgi:membrane protease YdiL (CAAX protease family)
VGGLALHMAVNTLKQYVTPVDDEFMTNFRLFQRSWDTREGTDLILPLLSLGLLSSVAQEIFFRGYMQTQLREVWGRIGALAIASLCFGLAHLGVADLLHYGFLDVGWLIPVGVAFIASLYYGWIRDITGSVVAAAACHVAWNASVVIRPFERLHRSFSSELWWLVFCLAVFIGCMWYLADELPLGGKPGEATEGLAR